MSARASVEACFWDMEAWPGPRKGHTQSSEGARAVEGMWEGHQGLDIKGGLPGGGALSWGEAPEKSGAEDFLAEPAACLWVWGEKSGHVRKRPRWPRPLEPRLGSPGDGVLWQLQARPPGL